MGVDTKGRLKGNISPEDVLNFIRQTFDKDAKSFIETTEYNDIKNCDFAKEVYGESEKWMITSGYINFNDGKNDRNLFYYYSNINSYENLDFYRNYGLEDMVKTETTHISLGYFGNSVEDILKIVSHFGGWIDDNDCDDNEYYYVGKSPDDKIKPIIHITMQDIYEKFGGTVVIDR